MEVSHLAQPALDVVYMDLHIVLECTANTNISILYVNKTQICGLCRYVVFWKVLKIKKSILYVNNSGHKYVVYFQT
jgi:hypothetical protein